MKTAQSMLDRVYVIVGGTRGLGLSAAKACLAAGARLVVSGSDAQDVPEAQVEQLDSFHCPRCCARQGTARRDVAVAIAFARAPEMRPGGGVESEKSSARSFGNPRRDSSTSTKCTSQISLPSLLPSPCPPFAHPRSRASPRWSRTTARASR